MGNYRPLLYSLGFIMIVGTLFLMVASSLDVVPPQPTGLKAIFFIGIDSIMSFFVGLIYFLLLVLEIIPNFFIALTDINSLSWGTILNPLIISWNFLAPTLFFPFLEIPLITSDPIVTLGFADLVFDFLSEITFQIGNLILYFILLPDLMFNIIVVLISVALLYGVIKIILP